MKKRSNSLFLISLIFVIAFYLVNIIFTLGTIFTPATALKTISVNPDKNQTVKNSFVTVDVSVQKPKADKPDQNDIAYINSIYVFVGEIRSYELDENGNPFAEIRFQFKTKSSNDGTAVYREIISKIPVRENSGGYSWIKVFDAKEEEKNDIGYERVKISIPDSLDLYEVVFTDVTGYVLKTSATYGTDNQIQEAKLVIDEQDMFTMSKAKKYNFTDVELKNLASVNALKDGVIEVGDAPLTTIAYFISTAIFGDNTFGLRFFDALAGLGMIILAFAFANKVFGKKVYGVVAMLSALTFGAIFTASNFALASMGDFFAVLSLYLASRFFVKHYYLEDKAEAISCIVAVGLSYGLAISCDMAYSLVIVGLIVLFAMARRRAYKQFKRLEKEAKGLEKEDVYVAYHKNSVTSLGVIALALVVAPIAIFTAFYSVCSSVYKAYYGAGFFASAFKHTVKSLTPAYQSSPFALFAGFGGLEFNVIHSCLNANATKVTEIGSYYSFLNYFTAILALLSFLFVTFVTFFGKKVEFCKNVGTITNKYKIITVAFLTMALPVFMGLTSSPYGFAGVSVFTCAYIAFAQSIMVKCIKRKYVNYIFTAIIAISFIIFAMAFVGLVGLNISTKASEILYFWQVL